MKTIKFLAAIGLATGLAMGASAQSGDTISKSAAVYATYQADVTDAKSKNLASAGDIDTALNNLGGHNSDQLTKGWIAYSALIASQDPEFRAAVKDSERHYGRQRVITGLQNDPRFAYRDLRGINGVSSALSATDADSRRLKSAAVSMKEQGFTLQSHGWAKAKIGNSKGKAQSLDSAQKRGRAAKGNLVSALGASDIDTILRGAGASGAPSLWDNVSGAASAIRVPPAVRSGFSSRKRIKSGKQPVADQIATLAAYRVLGASAQTGSQVHTAMAQRETSGCIKMAQLELQSCVAGAYQQYEVPFCISEHALSDVGQCIGGVSQ
jgi:hypothetical protein